MTYLYYGENIQERDDAIKRVLQEFTAVNGETAVESIDADATELTNLIDAVTTVPFLSPKRLVIMRYLSANKDVAASIEEVLDRTADSTDILFVESRLDARSVYTKTLKKRITTIKHFETVEGPALVGWVVREASAIGATISPAVAQRLINRVGHNQQLLDNELQKLSLISSDISIQLVESMTHFSPASSVFAMLDAVLKGNIEDASKLYYEQRMQGMEPQAILGMIAWQLHILAIIVAAKGLSADDIAKKAKLNPFVVRKNLAIAQRLSKQKIVSLFDVAIESDLRIKTGKSKPDAEIHVLLLRIALGVQTA